MSETRRSVESRGARISYRAWGPEDARSTLVVLHGFAQTGDFFSAFAALVCAPGDVRIVAPDLRAHGESGDFTDGPADDVFVEDVLTLWSEVVGRPAVWVGNSLGARIVALACAANPAAAERLVLGECNVGLERLRQILGAQIRQQMRIRPPFFASMDEARSYGEKVRHIRGAALELWLTHAVGTTDDGRFYEKLRATHLGPEYWPHDEAEIRRRLALIRAPVCLAYGGRSSVTSVAQQETIRSLFAQAEVRRVEGAGHDLFVEAPAQMAELVRAELRASR